MQSISIRRRTLVILGASFAVAVGLVGSTASGSVPHTRGVGDRLQAAQFGLFGVLALSPTDAWRVGDKQGHAAFSSEVPMAQHWDGSTWTSVPVPAPAGARQSRLVDVAAATAADVWAVGWSTTSSSDGEPLVERWDGGVWQQESRPDLGPYGGRLQGIVVNDPDDVWVTGWEAVEPGELNSIAAHWDGSAWSVDTLPEPKGAFYCYGSAVTSSGSDDVWVAGGCVTDERYDGVVDHWDGTSWSVAPTAPVPSDDLRGIHAFAPDDVWAVGSYARGTPPLIEHWDGSSWSVSPAKKPRGADDVVLTSVAGSTSTDVWAIGWYVVGGDGPETPLVLHWNGVSWKRTPVGAGPGTDRVLHTVSADSSTDAWFVADGGRGRGGFTEHWDGSSWVIQGQ